MCYCARSQPFVQLLLDSTEFQNKLSIWYNRFGAIIQNLSTHKPCVVVERPDSLLQLPKLSSQFLAWVVVKPRLPAVHAEAEMLIGGASLFQILSALVIPFSPD